MNRFLIVLLAAFAGVPALVACGVTPGDLSEAGPATAEPSTTVVEVSTLPALRPAPTLMPTATAERPTAMPTPIPTGATIAAVPDACPQPTDDTRLLINAAGGYCLLYPDSHTAVRGGFDGPEPNGVRIVNGNILNTDTWASVRVSEATGEDLAQTAREDAERLSGFDVVLTEMEVAGQPAFMLSGLPGQDLTRTIRFEHDGLLYSFQTGPDDVSGSETSRRADEFTNLLLNSLAFIPVSDVVTNTGECLHPRPDEQLIISEALGVCLLVPSDYVHEEPDRNTAAFHSGSIVDADHPQLSIEVFDAGSHTAGELTDELIREMNTITGEPVGFSMYTIGDGNTLAKIIDGAPGHELEHLLLVDHDNRRYQLTFAPYDPAQTVLSEAMKALILQVTQSFRFLP